eukprot:jgi/Mesvir1/17265/Mv07674-RA.1
MGGKETASAGHREAAGGSSSRDGGGGEYASAAICHDDRSPGDVVGHGRSKHLGDPGRAASLHTPRMNLLDDRPAPQDKFAHDKGKGGGEKAGAARGKASHGEGGSAGHGGRVVPGAERVLAQPPAGVVVDRPAFDVFNQAQPVRAGRGEPPQEAGGRSPRGVPYTGDANRAQGGVGSAVGRVSHEAAANVGGDSRGVQKPAYTSAAGAAASPSRDASRKPATQQQPGSHAPGDIPGRAGSAVHEDTPTRLGATHPLSSGQPSSGHVSSSGQPAPSPGHAEPPRRTSPGGGAPGTQPEGERRESWPPNYGKRQIFTTDSKSGGAIATGRQGSGVAAALEEPPPAPSPAPVAASPAAPFGTDESVRELMARTALVEGRLMTLGMEKTQLESELSRMPNTAGRTIAERKRKQYVEARLGELDTLMGSLRQQLR